MGELWLAPRPPSGIRTLPGDPDAPDALLFGAWYVIELRQRQKINFNSDSCSVRIGAPRGFGHENGHVDGRTDGLKKGRKREEKEKDYQIIRRTIVFSGKLASSSDVGFMNRVGLQRTLFKEESLSTYPERDGIQMFKPARSLLNSKP